MAAAAGASCAFNSSSVFSICRAGGVRWSVPLICRAGGLRVQGAVFGDFLCNSVAVSPVCVLVSMCSCCATWLTRGIRGSIGLLLI